MKIFNTEHSAVPYNVQVMPSFDYTVYFKTWISFNLSVYIFFSVCAVHGITSLQYQNACWNPVFGLLIFFFNSALQNATAVHRGQQDMKCDGIL